MDLWHGVVEFDDGKSYIQDFHFCHPDVASPFLGELASLKFLNVVEIADVPLYLVAGPCLDVWTDNERTEQWLHQCLFDGLKYQETEDSNPWRERSGGQSGNGILLSVHGGRNADGGPTPEITEILLYAANSGSSKVPAPPTPPTSSSPGPDNEEYRSSPNVRFYALPLSSKIYKTFDQAPITTQADPTSHDHDFYYLPSPAEAQSHHDDDPAAKRPKIETLFDGATQIRRLHKKRGGEGIAKAMAAMDARMAMPALSSSSTLPEPSKIHIPRTRTPFSRASTTGCINLSPPINASTSRPQSSHLSTQPRNQRSSLSRAPSVLSPSIDESRSSEIPETSHNDIEQQNKNSLSRIIMAGLRIYGLQQPRKKSISALETAESQASLTPCIGTVREQQDEYKAIYHQTFKAAAF
ncbi:MAG: hypothetical protein L6R42_007372, partial [Xanthoria sp. 1 TBL-2021]